MSDETDSFLHFFFACRKRFKKMTQEEFQRYQLKKAKEIVQYSVRNSPYFKKYFSGYNLDDVWNLPITNKKLMMDNFTEYNTLGFEKQELIDFCLRIEQEQNYNERFKGYNVAMSSGTSGNKGIVLTSPKEEKYLQAVFFARFPFPKILRLKWAFILRVTTPAFQVSKFGQRLTHFSLQLPLEDMRNKLQKFDPNILSAPPSMLKILANEVKEGRLKIKPKRLVSYAEVLHPEIKIEIEEAFKTKVHQIYQGSEGSIALTCKHCKLHINEDLLFVQLFDKKDNPIEPGKPSHKMIVTDLHKKSQPIIRFELNDVITLSSEKCSCGSSFRVIDQIMGRVDDVFWATRKDSGELQYIFPDYIRRAIISSSEEIDEYQVIQKSFTKIIVRIQTKEYSKENQELISNIQKNLISVFENYKCPTPKIDIRFEKPQRNPNSLKLIRIQRDFKIT
ncbi:MAG TPA: F390 synthetase-related protein [candidate division Zixibacteria bacterium]|nr:F390 synthetase-related protein [candidate division Zixibacteria bacterium]